MLREALIGAGLTGLVVFLFLRDWRSSLIVVITIPFALLGAVVALRLVGQTINIMTLGGLALAVGVLVDEATVLLENIHVHIEAGETTARAVLLASREVATPRLLAMLSVFAVFLPSFFMTGPARSLFLPLSLAVGFAMGTSYLLSSTLVPVLSNWFVQKQMRAEHHEAHRRRVYSISQAIPCDARTRDGISSVVASRLCGCCTAGVVACGAQTAQRDFSVFGIESVPVTH